MVQVGIYKITSPSGKVYIGQSHDIKNRFRGFKMRLGVQIVRLNPSLVKYGWEKHTKEVIHKLPKDVSQEVLDTYETLYMQAYRDCGVELLNTKEGGKSGKHADESRIKMSESAKHRESYVLTDAGVATLRECAMNARTFIKNRSHRKGKIHTDETKAKISQTKKGCDGPRKKKVICTTTGIIYDSIKDAAKFIEVKHSTLIAQMRGQSKNKTTFIYYKQ